MLGLLHARIYRRQARAMRAAMAPPNAAFLAYERAYTRAVCAYLRRSSWDIFLQRAHAADIVFVGDYHTLPAAQRTFADLHKELGSHRRVVVALEFVAGHQQALLDAYMAGALGEAAFVAALGHDRPTLQSAWPQIADILAHAKACGHGVVGIDSRQRRHGAGSLAARDAYAAKIMVRALRVHPDACVLVLCGDLHVAPVHLPRAVQQCWRGQGVRSSPLRTLVLYQNCPSIYRQLQRRGLAHCTPMVQVGATQFCALNTPPILCQQSFLNSLQPEEDGDFVEDPRQTLQDCVRLVADFFDLRLRGRRVRLGADAEVASVADLSFLQRLRRRGDFTANDMRLIRAQIAASESYFIPRAKMIYLGNFALNHVSEEATHYIRHLCARLDTPRLLVDAFYARVIEEALGFLGSRIINPRRRCAMRPDFVRLAHDRQAPAAMRKMARLTLCHLDMEAGRPAPAMQRVYNCDAGSFNGVTHALGYRLGARLYNALLQGQLQRQSIRKLFYQTFARPGQALATYLVLLHRTGHGPYSRCR